jgi:hypothetical protein
VENTIYLTWSKINTVCKFYWLFFVCIITYLRSAPSGLLGGKKKGRCPLPLLNSPPY